MMKKRQRKYGNGPRSPEKMLRGINMRNWGYNYRMSNVIAGVVRGQFPYLKEHIAQKKAIYERYKDGLKGLPVHMNPYDGTNSEPNFWLSCMIIEPDAMCKQVRGEQEALYIGEPEKAVQRKFWKLSRVSMQRDGRYGNRCICSQSIA